MIQRFDVAPGGSAEDMIATTDGSWVMFDDFHEALNAAMSAERERCAKLCEARAEWEDLNPAEALTAVAAEIRKA